MADEETLFESEKKERLFAKDKMDIKNEAGEFPAKALRKARIPLRQKINTPRQASGIDQIYQYDPNTAVQTGYGLSNWMGKNIFLSWSGPVTAAQNIQLWFMPPLLNLGLAFARMILLVLLVGFLSEIKPFNPFKKINRKAAAAGFILIFLLCANLHNAHADDTEIPPDAILKELKTYVISNMEKQPDCLPDCGSISRMKLQVTGKQLSLRMQVQIKSEAAVPLHKVVSNKKINWRPDAVSVDGSAEGVFLSTKNGYLWIILKEGVHQVIITGQVPDMDALSINFLLKPYYSEYETVGWNLFGIYNNGETDSNIQLVRIKAVDEDDEDSEDESFEKSKLPPLLKVQRNILFGTSWTVNTQVTRISPQGSGVAVNIPLLNGESVTTPGIRVKDKAAMINMSAGASRVSWDSVLKITPDLSLSAPETLPWTEIWKLNVTNLWHMSYKGIPKIYTDSNILEWRPWPGESLDISLTKPQGIAAPTKTIDNVWLTVNSGQRSLNAELKLKIRSSIGGQHNIKLPKDAQIQQIIINNRNQPIQQNKGNVPIFLSPGTQNIQISWKQTKGISELFKVPAVSLGLKAVNIETVLTLPHDRWALFTKGPIIGPAVLFWGSLAVIVLLAFLLGLSKVTPLKIHHWLLLMIGLSQTDLSVNLIVIGWLLVMGWRKKDTMPEAYNGLFDLRQIILALWGITAIICIFTAIKHGLLGSPNMKILGNGSSAYYLKWFQDIADSVPMRPWVLSIDLIYYRILMLIWALWLAFAFTSWLKWGWICFSEGGLWKFNKKNRKKNKTEEEHVVFEEGEMAVESEAPLSYPDEAPVDFVELPVEFDESPVGAEDTAVYSEDSVIGSDEGTIDYEELPIDFD